MHYNTLKSQDLPTCCMHNQLRGFPDLKYYSRYNHISLRNDRRPAAIFSILENCETEKGKDI